MYTVRVPYYCSIICPLLLRDKKEIVGRKLGHCVTEWCGNFKNCLILLDAIFGQLLQNYVQWLFLMLLETFSNLSPKTQNSNCKFNFLKKFHKNLNIPMVVEATLNKVAVCVLQILETYYLVKHLRTVTFPFIHSRPIFFFCTSNQTHAIYCNRNKQSCNESTSVKPVFNTFKLAFLSAFKDKFAFGLKSDMVYTFLLDGCITRYVVAMCKNIFTKTGGYLETAKRSKIC